MMLGDNSTPFRPTTSTEFKQQLAQYDGDAYREQIGSVVDRVWPVVTDGDQYVARPKASGDGWEPSYREHQRETVVDAIEKLYVEDNDVLLLSAPTGAGKSLLIYSVAAVLDEVTSDKSFITTPLNTLIDQMEHDDYLHDVITIKGRNNYTCVHPQDSGAPVDKAICQRDDDFDCQFKDQSHERGGCLYYGRKMVAQERSKVVTNLSFLMANSMIPDLTDAGFDKRELLAVDECQNIEDFALMFVGFTVSEYNVPVDWNDLPPMPNESSSMDEVIDWLQQDVLLKVTKRIEELEAKKEGIAFSDKEQEQLEDLRRFNQKVNNFLSDVREHHWTKEHDDYEDKIEFKPVFVGRFLDGYLWSQAHKIVASSATIPPSFTEEVGLDDREIARIDVESTFPAERRPVITENSVGKMNYHNIDATLPKMADQIGRIADMWDGHKGFVHCHAYHIAEKLYDRLPHDVQQRARLQDQDNREESLQEWMESDVDESGYRSDQGGQIFLSVAMDEGISLDDDLARWQVVAKAAYPNMNDARVDYRMDSETMDGTDWNWYSAKAAINLQQAVGRGMRSKEDWCASYILDDSAVQLIERNEHLCESWFLDAVDCDFDEDVVSPENHMNGESASESDGDKSSLDDIADEYFG